MYRVVQQETQEDRAMHEQTISVRAWTPARPAEVWALLRDGATWPAWSPLDSFSLEREAPGGGDGLGAVRVFRTGRATSREEVVAFEPDRRLGYELLSGLPLRDYRASVDLEESDGGTAIHWHSTFRAKLPGTGGLFRRFLGGFIQRCADGLAARATELAERAAAP
jgi:hypothetical protein